MAIVAAFSGAIAVFTVLFSLPVSAEPGVGTTFVEEVVEYDRPTRWAYSVRSGAPVRDHLGTIDLRTVGSGTEVTWHVRAQPTVPGSGPLIARPSKVLVDGLLKGALRLAERRSRRGPAVVQDHG